MVSTRLCKFVCLKSDLAMEGPGANAEVEVQLNVYDLLIPQIPQTMTSFCHHMGIGFYHSGVSIFGTEYCYGGHPDDSTGVFEVTPKSAPEAKFRETIVVGKTSLNPIDVAILVNQMAASSFWRGNSYNLLTRFVNLRNSTAD